MFENASKVDASRGMFNDVKGNQTINNITNNAVDSPRIDPWTLHMVFLQVLSADGLHKMDEMTVALVLWHTIFLADVLFIFASATREADMACLCKNRSSRGYRLKFNSILEHKIKAWKNLECLNTLNKHLPQAPGSATGNVHASMVANADTNTIDKANVIESIVGSADTDPGNESFIAKGAPLVPPTLSKGFALCTSAPDFCAFEDTRAAGCLRSSRRQQGAALGSL